MYSDPRYQPPSYGSSVGYPRGHDHYGVPVMDPVVAAALNRPWQTTLYGWLQVVAAIAGLLGGLVWAAAAGSSAIDYQFVRDGGPIVLIGIVTVALLIVMNALNLWIASAFLRGSRGAYVCYSVLNILGFIGTALVLAGMALFLFTVSAVDSGGGDDEIVALILMIAVSLLVAGVFHAIPWYLLWNRSSKAYFDRESVQIRRDARAW